jgi:hypothetical protein
MNICGCSSLHSAYLPKVASTPAHEDGGKAANTSAVSPGDPQSSPNSAHSNADRESSKVRRDLAKAALTAEELQQVRDLQLRDRQVRAHEQAHLAAAGGLATGGASFDYQTGPDGKRYAVGGEVQVSTTMSAANPQANLQKAMQLQRAALAPADPSPQDRAVAMNAAAMAQKARTDILEKVQEAKEAGLRAKQSADKPSGVTENTDSAVEPQNAVDAEQQRLASVKRAVAVACGMCGAEDHNDGIHAAANERKLQSAMRVHHAAVGAGVNVAA